MASKQTRLDINITATDNASSKIDGIKDELDKIDGTTEIAVDVDDNATSNFDRIVAKAREVDGTKAEVAVDVDDNASRPLDQISTDVRNLDGDDAKVTVNIDDNASRKLDGIQSDLRDLDGSSTRIGVDTSGFDGLGGLGKGGLIGGAAAGVGKILYDSAQGALQVQTIADLTGSSVDDASRLTTIWEQSSTGDAADLLDVLLQMNQSLADNPELADELNVNMQDGKGDVERFVEVVGNIGTEVDDASERARIMGKLFGEEGVRQVGSMVTRVGDLKTAVEGVPSAGVITEEDVERARELNEQVVSLQGKWAAFKLELSRATIPTLDELLSDPTGRSVGGVGPSRSPFDLGARLGSSIAEKVFGSDSGSFTGSGNPIPTGVIVDPRNTTSGGPSGSTTNVYVSALAADEAGVARKVDEIMTKYSRNGGGVFRS